MKISEFIESLQRIQEEHGDLEVHTYGRYGRMNQPAPTVAFCKLLKGRETRLEFLYPWEPEERRGEKVCKV